MLLGTIRRPMGEIQADGGLEPGAGGKVGVLKRGTDSLRGVGGDGSSSGRDGG
jgi:hypothetical protein